MKTFLTRLVIIIVTLIIIPIWILVLLLFIFLSPLIWIVKLIIYIFVEYKKVYNYLWKEFKNAILTFIKQLNNN